MTTKLEAIRALNDELRHNLTTGTAFLTTGVAALGAKAVARIVKTIAVYDDFCHANDPYEAHDFGSFEADDHVIFFKIDYYDKSRSHHSPDPSDPEVTERVITLGIDLGKNVCSLAGLDQTGKVILRRRIKRGGLPAFRRNAPPLHYRFAKNADPFSAVSFAARVTKILIARRSANGRERSDMSLIARNPRRG